MRQYIGARYVPVIFQNPDDGTNNWKSDFAYEPLTIVSYGGASYTSKKAVPASVGNPGANPDYWVAIGLYSGQTTANTQAIAGIKAGITPYIEATSTASRNYSKDEFVWLGDVLYVVTSNIASGETLSPGVNLSAYTILPTVSEQEFFRNKRIMVCGDSISDEGTYAPNWVELLRNYLAPVGATVINKSVSGITLVGSTGMAAKTATFTDTNIDIIIFEVGTNDCNVQAIIGNNQATSIDTVIGAMKTMRDQVVARWPNAQVFFIIPPRCALSDTTTPPILKQYVPRCLYRHVLQIWANQFCWNLIDASCGLPQFDLLNNTIKNLYSDGIHPKDNYAPRFMHYVVQQLISGGTTTIGFEQTKVNYTEFVDTDNFETPYAEMTFDSNGNIHIYMNSSRSINTGTVNAFKNLPSAFRDLLTAGIAPYGYVMNSEVRIILFDMGGATIRVQTNAEATARIDYRQNLDESLGLLTTISQ